MTLLNLLQWNERVSVQSQNCRIGKSVAGEEKRGKKGVEQQLMRKQIIMGGWVFFFQRKRWLIMEDNSTSSRCTAHVENGNFYFSSSMMYI